MSLAEANLAISRAIYRQVIGHDPGGLIDGFPYRPARSGAARGRRSRSGRTSIPIILAAIHQADAQAFVVKQIEGELLPTVEPARGRSAATTASTLDRDPNAATIIGRISIPLFPGRRRLSAHPPGQGDLRPAEDRDRPCPRPGARGRRLRLGAGRGCRAARSSAARGRRRGGGDRADRRAGGAEGRPAHHARRARRAAGAARRPRDARHRPRAGAWSPPSRCSRRWAG